MAAHGEIPGPHDELFKRRYGLKLFLEGVSQETTDSSWSPTVEDVGDLHKRLNEVFLAWMRERGRHP